MEREYRNIAIDMFKRGLDDATEEKTYNVRGYASTFEEYELFADEMGSFCERIEPDAFEGCDMSDVVFRKDHEGTVFARTSNGSLILSVDKHGLLTDTDLSRTASAKACYEEIDTGMYTQMSIAFVVSDDDVTYNKEARKYLRTIKRISKLYDVSPVSFPANPGTDIYSRSRFDGVIEAVKQELLEREKNLKRMAEQRAAMLAKIGGTTNGD